jgi:hypothetical protein
MVACGSRRKLWGSLLRPNAPGFGVETIRSRETFHTSGVFFMPIGRESSEPPSILIKNNLWGFQKRKTLTFSIQSPIRRFLFKPLNSHAKRGIFVRLNPLDYHNERASDESKNDQATPQSRKNVVDLEAGVVSAARGGARPTSQCAAPSAVLISHSFDEIGGR